MKKTGVYLIKNKVNGKAYVGCSIDIEERWRGHIWETNSKKSTGYNFAIHRAIRKYGLDNFEFTILEQTEDTYNREKYWIERYDSYNNGYNETTGGDCGPVKVGEENGNASLSTQDVINIRTRLLNGEMLSVVFKDYEDKISPEDLNIYGKEVVGHI